MVEGRRRKVGKVRCTFRISFYFLDSLLSDRLQNCTSWSLKSSEVPCQLARENR